MWHVCVGLCGRSVLDFVAVFVGLRDSSLSNYVADLCRITWQVCVGLCSILCRIKWQVCVGLCGSSVSNYVAGLSRITHYVAGLCWII